MENLGGGYGHKLKAILLSIVVAVSGWVVPAQSVYAETYYYDYSPLIKYAKPKNIYIPKSYFNGCPQISATTINYRSWNNGDGELDHHYYAPANLWTMQYSIHNEAPHSSDGDSYPSKRTRSYLILNTPTVTVSGNNYVFSAIGYFSIGESPYPNYTSSSDVLRPLSSVSLWSEDIRYLSDYNPYIPTQSMSENWRNAYSVPSGNHNFTSNTATCTSAGVKRCSTCGYSESTPALGHSENSGSVTTSPTCTTAGVKTFNCSRCGAYLRSASVPASGHSWGSGNGAVTQNQSCILPEIRYNKCTKCSATNGTKQTKAALGHDWRNATLSSNNGVKIEPTVYNDGTYYQKCSRCSTGHSGDPYTNHFNVISGTQKHFSIYVGDKRVQAIYLGDTPIMNANIGNNSLVA